MRPLHIAPLFALLLLTACIQLRPVYDDAPSELTSTQDLIHYLGTKGIVARPLVLSSARVTTIPGQAYRLDQGGVIEVFEFASNEDAEEGVEDYQIERVGGGTSTLFHRGDLVVAYHGERAEVMHALDSALGPAVY